MVQSVIVCISLAVKDFYFYRIVLKFSYFSAANQLYSYRCFAAKPKKTAAWLMKQEAQLMLTTGSTRL